MRLRSALPHPAAVLVGALVVAAFPAGGSDTGPGRLTWADVAPGADATGPPRDLAWNHDGTRLAYLYDDGQGRALWTVEVSTGAFLRRLADGALADGLDAFHWSPASDDLLLESGDDLFLLPAAADRPRLLTGNGSDASDPEFSPDGRRIAFVRDHDLHVLDLADGRVTALTGDGEANVRLNGETDWVYWEEIYGRAGTGFWWSPGGDRLAFYQFDETPVESYPLVDFTPTYPDVKWQKYPKAGSANPRVRIGVVSAAAAGVTWLETGRDADVYLARVRWAPDGRWLLVERLNRDQDRLDLLRCDARRGRCRTLHTETWPTWINLGDDFAFLADGRFIRGSERDGWRRLDLHAADGRLLRTLTPPEWAVTSLDAVDEPRGWLTATGFRIEEGGARERHVLRVPLAAGGGVEMHTTGRGWNGALVAPGSGAWVLTAGDAETPTSRTVRGGGRSEPLVLPGGPAPAWDPAGLPRWEFLFIPGPGGERLPAALLKPADFDPSRRYPAIMYHYGGPGSQVVADRWSRQGSGLWHKLMAQRGYVVLSVDNPASIFFGKKGEDRQHRRFGEINLAAQKAGAAWLASRSWIDGDRLGLWGWSGGGTNTLYCLFNAPGTWRAGVAGAPVTDWRLYDTIWTERYLDHPADNPEGYEASSPVTHAAGLADALLVLHGTADDNVHPQNTLVLAHRLIAAERPFEQAIYPRQMHGFRGLASRHVYRRMAEFFDRHLGGGDAAGVAGNGSGKVP